MNLKLNFQSFIKKSVLNEQRTYFSEGIDHIENLSIEDFLFVIENFNKMIASQKLDGANLVMGIDENGKFFTSRESKGGQRFYKSSDYPNDGAMWDGFRSAHIVLEKKKRDIAKIFGKDSKCEVEVLYKRQPNAITYGKDGLNYLAFLRMLPTPSKDIPDQTLINKIFHHLENDIVKITSKVTDSEDGETIITSNELSSWKFVTPEKITPDKFKSVDLSKEIRELKSYLNQKNKEASKLNHPEIKTNYDVMVSRVKDLQEEKEKVKEIVQNKYKLSIKDTLLNNFVRKIKPSIQDSELSPDEDLGIEGVVFLDPVSQKQFKIVDTDIFTTINQFNHEIRSNISGTIKSSDPLTSLANRGGIFGDSKIRMIKLLGIDGLMTASNVKRTLKKFGGSTPEENLKNIAKSLNQINFQAVKRKMESILIYTLKQLEDALIDFKNGVDKYKKELSTGKVMGYSPEIKKRTLITFAETKKSLEDMLIKIKKSKNIVDIIIILFGKQIKEIYMDTGDE